MDVMKWVIALRFLYVAFLKFHEGMMQLMTVPQIQGNNQAGLGTNLNIVTGAIYFIVILATLAFYLGVWTLFWEFLGPLLLEGLDHVTDCPPVWQAYSLLCELFPLQFLLACLGTYWSFMLTRSGTMAVCGLVIKAQRA